MIRSFSRIRKDPRKDEMDILMVRLANELFEELNKKET